MDSVGLIDVFSISFLTQRAEVDIFFNSSSYLSWLILLETAWIEHSFTREDDLFFLLSVRPNKK